jgi:hypothetical protein
MFGEGWFAKVREELVRVRKVRFVFSPVEKGTLEISKVREAVRFVKQMSDVKRIDTIRTEYVDREMQFLQTHSVWIAHKRCCNDSHFFALHAVLPVEFVFSMDAKMALCRNIIGKELGIKYSGFAVITTFEVYCRKRDSIIY